MRTLLTSVAAGLFALGVTGIAEAQKGGRGGNSGQGQRHGEGQAHRQGNNGQGQANHQRASETRQRGVGATQVGVDRQPGADVSVTRHKSGKGQHFPGDGHNHGGKGKHFPGDGHNHGGNWSGNWKHYPGDGHNHNWNWYRNNYGRNNRWYGNNWRWNNNNNYWRWLPTALRFLNGGGGFPGYGGFGDPYYGGGYGGYSPYYAYDSSYSTDSVASAPAPNPAPDQAVVHVILPDANATVSLNGEKIESSGRERDFFSPKLEAGRQYTYTVTASWSLGDRRVGDSRTIFVTAGQATVVDFTRPATTPFTTQPISR